MRQTTQNTAMGTIMTAETANCDNSVRSIFFLYISFFTEFLYYKSRTSPGSFLIKCVNVGKWLIVVRFCAGRVLVSCTYFIAELELF